MVMLRDISLESHCEHHMVAISGRNNAYMPVDKVVGISKLARVIEIFAKRCKRRKP